MSIAAWNYDSNIQIKKEKLHELCDVLNLESTNRNSVKEMFSAYGFAIKFNKEGGISECSFKNEYAGEEFELLEALAGIAEENSHIEIAYENDGDTQENEIFITRWSYAEKDGVKQEYAVTIDENEHEISRRTIGEIKILKPEKVVDWFSAKGRAIDRYQLGIDSGDMHAAYMMAMLYVKGTGVKKNPETAIKYLLMAANDENFQKGPFYKEIPILIALLLDVEMHKPEAAAKWYYESQRVSSAGGEIDLKELASNGNAAAQYYYGQLLRDKYKKTRDRTFFKEARVWEKKSESQNYPLAMALSKKK